MTVFSSLLDKWAHITAKLVLLSIYFFPSTPDIKNKVVAIASVSLTDFPKTVTPTTLSAGLRVEESMITL